MIDHARRQRDTIAREGLQLVAEGVTQEGWAMGVTRRQWPVGARFFWAISEVYAPRPEHKEAAE